jgi:hypothetical protein
MRDRGGRRRKGRARGGTFMEAEETPVPQESPETTETTETGVREVVGLFNTLDSLQSAIDELLTSGFDRSDITLLAEDHLVREKVGGKSAAEMEDGQAPRTPYIESESLNEGKASLLGLFFYVGAIFGASVLWAMDRGFAESIFGGVVTGMIAALAGVAIIKSISKRQAKWVQAQLERGGLLLWARAWDQTRERAAIDIMQRNGGHDVHAHAEPA